MVIFFIFVLLSTFCASQQISAQSIFLSKHRVSFELLAYKPNIIHYTSHNLTWIGTQEGLFLYDGRQLIKFERSDLCQGKITSLYDDEKKLWVGYEDGSLFFLENNQLVRHIHSFAFLHKPIINIKTDTKGSLFVATYGDGLFIFEQKNHFHLNTKNGLSSDDVYGMDFGQTEQLIVVTDIGIDQIVYENDKWKSQQNLDPLLPKDVFTSISYDEKTGVFWLGSFESDLIFTDLKNKTKQIEGVKAYKVFTAMENYLFVADEEYQHFHLINKRDYSQSQISFTNLQENLQVIDFTVRNDMVWILCRKNGLISGRLNVSAFDVNVKEVQTILKMEDKVFLGTSKSLFTFNLKTYETQEIAKDNFLDITFDRNHNKLYCATFGNGVLMIDLYTGRQRYITENEGLANNSVLSITDEDKLLMVSTLGGVSIFDKKNAEIDQNHQLQKSSFPYVYKTILDNEGNFWIGTDGKGLLKIHKNGELNKIYTKGNVYHLVKGEQGKIWFHSSVLGVCYDQNGSIKCLEDISKIKSDGITNMILTLDQDILVFGEEGIGEYISPNYHFSPIDMSQSNLQWDQNLNAVTLDNDGTVWFASGDQLIKYIPVSYDKEPPTLFVHYALCGNTDLLNNDKEKLSYEENDFVVEFSAIWPKNVEQLKIRYKLKGLSDEWKYTKDSKIIFSNLPSGIYHFDLECDRTSSFKNSAHFHLSFEIKPAYWNRWWFRLLMVMGFIGLIYNFFYWRNKRQDKINQLNTENARSELEMIKSQINPHFLFNNFNTLISVIETNQEDAVAYVNKLSDFYRSILAYREVEIISIKEELKLLDDYLFLLNKRFGKNLNVEILINENHKGYLIPLSLQLLIENAVKHNVVSKAKNLTVTISIDNKFIKVCNDLQTKMTIEESTHYGLQSLEKRYLLLTDFHVLVEKTTDKFCVSLPLIYKS